MIQPEWTEDKILFLIETLKEVRRLRKEGLHAQAYELHIKHWPHLYKNGQYVGPSD